MQGVEGQWNGELKFDGRSISLHPRSLTKLFVINTIHQHLPSIQLGFKDDTAADVASMGLGDSSKLQLTLGDGTSDEMSATFTLIGDLRIEGDYSAEHVDVSGVLDHLPWMRKIVSGHTEGTSSDAIAKVAGEAGLQFESHQTSDKQIWLPNNRPLASFARHVMERGWASASSCMMLAVSDSSTCRYFDVDQIQSSGKLFGVDGHPILKFQINGKADVYNNSVGYGATSTNFKPDGEFNKFTKVAVKMLSSNLSAGAANIAAIGEAGGRILSRALDTGNVHEKWNEAQHQNQRIRSMYSHDVHILSDKLSGVELLDKVQLNLLTHGGGQPMASHNGEYIVSAYTRGLAANRYIEKITLTSQGTN